MVPSTFILLDAMPLTANGKIDRRALPALGLAQPMTEESFVPPTLPLHYQLISIWEELLDVKPIGIGDNFFYLGGHSLLAARLVTRIEEVCGKRLDLATLFANPTIEQIAEALQKQEEMGARSRPPIVTVQAGGSRRPFFFLHGDFADGAFYCFPLAQALGSDQPFYAIEPYRFDDLRLPLSIEAMAATHIETLRTVQPEGPYLLGGFCNGAVLAYEMARQLHADGQKLDLLLLIDPMPLGPFYPVHYRINRAVLSWFGTLIRLSQEKQWYWYISQRKLLQDIYNHLRHSYSRGSKECRHKVNESMKLERRHNIGGSTHPGSDAFSPSDEALRETYGFIYDWIAMRYRPANPYPGKITFFWFRDEIWRTKAWSKMTDTSEMEVHIIPGTQLSSRTEYLPVLAEQLKECLNKVHATALRQESDEMARQAK